MTATHPIHPWVAERRDRISFALQVFPTETPPADRGRGLLAAGRLADDLGLDAFFVGDHPAWGPECWVHLAALAATTDRIRLGVGVCCALYRHPVMTARLAADLDNLSGGRLVLGLGAGWDAAEFASLGLPFPPVGERQARLNEAIAIIRAAWGPEPYAHAGRYYSCTAAQILPPPVQRLGPPLMIAGGGERVTLRQVAQHADACNLGDFGKVSGSGGPEGIARKLAVLRGHYEALGRPYESVLRTHLTGWLILAEDEAGLRAKVGHYVPEGLEQRFTGDWTGFGFAGTPEQAVAYYQSLAEVGIQYFIVQTLDAGDQETVRLLAQAVVPAIRV